MKQTAVEWFNEEINKLNVGNDARVFIAKLFEQAKEMESKERLKHLLFIGKVTEILGFDKTVEILKECNNEII
jgi:hypothetical protein